MKRIHNLKIMHRKGLLFAAALVLLLLIVGAAADRSVRAEETDTCGNGIYIENICVSGMTREEVDAAMQARLSEFGQGIITVQVGAQTTQISAAEMGLYQTNTEIASSVMQMGNKGNIWKRYCMKNSLNSGEAIVFEMDLAVSEDAVRAMVEERCAALNIQREDMKLVWGDDGKLYPTGKTDGLYVDVDATTAAICSYMNNDWHGGYGTIAAVTQVDEAAGDAETYSLVTDVLGQGTTEYDAESEEQEARNTNLAVGASKLNGLIVYPGEEFSAEEYLTPFTEEAGYAVAGAYLDGKVVDDIGGGICQVTSTLYRAVLEAELDVTERCQHSMIVGYVDPSMDASVAEGVKDFKFINNTDAPIYIEGYAADGTVQFTIYGHETRDASHSIAFESEITSQTDPKTDVYTLDDDLDFGEVNTVDAHTGMEATAYKIVYENGVEVSRTAIAWSDYEVSDGGYNIGIKGATQSQIAELQKAVDAKNITWVKAIAAQAETSDSDTTEATDE